MTRNEHQMYSDVSSIAKSLEKIASVLEHMNHDSYLAKQDIPKFQDIPGFEGTLDALDDLYKPDMSVYGNKDEYETDLQGVRKDDDHDIRSAAQHYEFEIGNGEDIKTKKDAILDYITNEFGLKGARYTDIIKFAYYLGNSGGAKFTTRDRGYYSCAISGNNAHLTKGGKDYLVKGINNEGIEKYFALSHVDNATGFWKRIS
jgi:hypothetical protein